MDNDLKPTLAFELRDAEHERSVRAFLDAIDDVDYYVMRDAKVVSHAVLVIHSASMVLVGQLLVPRS